MKNEVIQMSHPVESIMRTTMEQLIKMVDVDTVVGNPISAEDETMILPVSKVSMGFLSGGGEYSLPDSNRRQAPVKSSGVTMDEEEGKYPFAGTSVAGLTVTPVAFVSVTQGSVRVIPTQYKDTLDRLVEMIPEAILSIKEAIMEVCAHREDEEYQ